MTATRGSSRWGIRASAGGRCGTASAEFPAANSSSPSSAAGVTRVNPFAAPPVAATTSGDWLPGDGTDEPAEPAAAVVFAASDAAPAAATPPIPMDWAAEMAAFAGPDDGSADPFAAAPQSPAEIGGDRSGTRGRGRPGGAGRSGRVRPGRTSARPRVGRRPGSRNPRGDARGDPAAPPRRAGRDGDRGANRPATAGHSRRPDGRGPVRALNWRPGPRAEGEPRRPPEHPRLAPRAARGLAGAVAAEQGRVEFGAESQLVEGDELRGGVGLGDGPGAEHQQAA